MVTKIVSGVQTGADQAGLEAAVVLSERGIGIEPSGLIPRGRRTQAGPLSDVLMKRWNVSEHPSAYYPPRTEANVIRSGGTVWFGNPSSPGGKLTIRFCIRYDRPYILNPNRVQFLDWTTKHRILVLNVAGNREETNPGIYQRTLTFLVDSLGGSNGR